MKKELRRSDVVAFLIVAATIMMFIQFTIIGKIVYVGYVGMVILFMLFLLWLVRETPLKLKMMGVIALVLITAPVAEETWIAYCFEKVCENAGVHVKRKVKADGYYNDTFNLYSNVGPVKGRSMIESLDNKGYKFIEGRAGSKWPKGKVSHIEKTDDGQWYITILDSPIARYHYKKPIPKEKLGHRLFNTRYIVVDSQNAEIIGYRNLYKRYPGLIEALWVRWFGSGLQMCPNPEEALNETDLLGAVISPR